MPDNVAITANQLRTSLKTYAITLPMLAAFVLTSGMVHAQNAIGQGNTSADNTRASYAACLTAAAGVTPDMKQCMGAEYAYQDKRLNVAYKALMAASDESQQTKLRSDERAWITYRTSHCALDQAGGQAAELDAYDCSVQETAKQARALEDRLHNKH